MRTKAIESVNPEPDAARGEEEAYASAMQSSNLRVQVARHGDGDVIVVAGWNRERIGAGLLRLQTEFDRAERPRQVRFAEFLPALVQEAAAKAKNGRLTQHEKNQLKAQAHRVASELNHAQTSVYLQRLRGFPVMREQLVIQLERWRAEDALTKATQILRWWLEQKCTSCNGRRWLTVEGTGRLSNKACPACKASSEREIPHGQEGRRLVCHIAQCVESWRSRTRKALRG